MLPVFLDSPMAIEALARYRQRVQELDPDVQPEAHDQVAPHGPADRENSREARRRHAERERQLCAFCTERFRTVPTAQESRQLTQSKRPAIIISASGMATGGRVLNHLAAGLPDSRNTVLLVGFQAAGTRGRHLADGGKSVRIHGEDVAVNAHVESIGSMSAHADSLELMRWLGGFKRPPARTFIVHGEPEAMDALDRSIAEHLGWPTMIPEYLQTVEL